MSKVAFVSGYYFIHQEREMDVNLKFMYESLYDSAKKYFLPNHEVDFIFMTNSQNYISNARNVRIDKYLNGQSEMLLMKIKCLNYLTKDYDYIFVSDGDQIFVDYVNDDFLDNNFVTVKHFHSPNSTGILKDLTEFVTINGDTDKTYWCTGNFFGGKSDTFKFILNKTNEHDEYYKQFYTPSRGYYATYPDEVLLMKILIEENVNYTTLPSSTELIISDNKSFLGDFINDSSLYPNFNNVKLLHNTKKNINLLREVIKYYK